MQYCYIVTELVFERVLLFTDILLLYNLNLKCQYGFLYVSIKKALTENIPFSFVYAFCGRLFLDTVNRNEYLLMCLKV